METNTQDETMKNYEYMKRKTRPLLWIPLVIMIISIIGCIIAICITNAIEIKNWNENTNKDASGYVLLAVILGILAFLSFLALIICSISRNNKLEPYKIEIIKNIQGDEGIKKNIMGTKIKNIILCLILLTMIGGIGYWIWSATTVRKEFTYIGIDNSLTTTIVEIKVEAVNGGSSIYYKEFAVELNDVSYACEGFTISSGKGYDETSDGVVLENATSVVRMKLHFKKFLPEGYKKINLKYDGKKIATIKG